MKTNQIPFTVKNVVVDYPDLLLLVDLRVPKEKKE